MPSTPCRLRAPKSFFVVAPSPRGDVWHIGHVITGEVVALPAHGGAGQAWEVEDDEVQPFVSNDAESYWCQQLFEWAVYAAEGCDDDWLFVSLTSGARIPLREWRRQYSVCLLAMPLEHRRKVEVRCYLFKHMHSGSRVWLCLASFYDQFGFTAKKGRSQKWYNHQWATWRRQLADMQIDPDVALRKAMAIGDMEKDDFDFRCLERATISMHGLLALLLRWVCFPDSRGRHPLRHVAGQVVVQGVRRRALHSPSPSGGDWGASCCVASRR